MRWFDLLWAAGTSSTSTRWGTHSQHREISLEHPHRADPIRTKRRQGEGVKLREHHKELESLFKGPWLPVNSDRGPRIGCH